VLHLTCLYYIQIDIWTNQALTFLYKHQFIQSFNSTTNSTTNITNTTTTTQINQEHINNAVDGVIQTNTEFKDFQLYSTALGKACAISGMSPKDAIMVYITDDD
jgi:hypothetical protein